MADWREPLPERRDEDDGGERDRGPGEPDMRDPEAQRAPGEDPSGTGVPGEEPPPMRADAGVIELDAEGIGYEPVGTDNIREGRVGGVMGSPHAGRGQGQGG